MKKNQKGSDPFEAKGVRPHLVLIFLGWFVAAGAPLSHALENTFSGNYAIPESQIGFSQEQYEVRMVQKFQRGVENFLFGWLEVPQGVKEEFGFRQDYQLPAGVESVFIGAFKGFFKGARRMAVGLYEGFTCIYPQEPILTEMSEWLY